MISEKDKLWNKLWFKLAIIVVPVCLYLFVGPFQAAVKQAIFILSMVNVSVVKGYILSFGLWAPVVSFLLMVFQSLIAPLPAFVITFANAGLFGWVKGAILSWSSAMVGAVLCYAIARVYGRSVVEKLTTRSALKQVDIFFEKYGKWAVLVARLLPFVSFDIVSYAAGLTAIGFWEFFWATGLGQLPATLIYSYVGDMLVGSVKTFVFGLLILFALSILIFVGKTIWQERNRELTTPHGKNQGILGD
ncbi:MAG: TVP38/TMEM64 family protein [Bacillota bacterium]|jgi:uncharacterized membrane protein YdjX (TVP38/TMEM64 family)